MLIVILIYDQLLFRPLVTWADRFRFEQEQNEEPPESWVLTMFRRSRLIDAVAAPFKQALRWSYRLAPPPKVLPAMPGNPAWSRAADIFWFGLLALLILYAVWRVFLFVSVGVSLSDLVEASLLWAGDDGTRVCPHCHRERNLDANRNLCWIAAEAFATGSAHRPVSGCVSGKHSFSFCCLCDRYLQSEPGYLAVSADGARHAMVHSLQCYCRRIGTAIRIAGCRRQIFRCVAGYGGEK